MDQNKVAAFLAELRKAKGWTQAQLGEKVGATGKTVSRWETGAYLPDADVLLALSELYGVTVNELLHGARLKEEQTQSEEVLRYVLKDSRRRIKEVVHIAAIFVSCVLFFFTAAFGAAFLSARRNMLYPTDIADVWTNKSYQGSLTVEKTGAGNTVVGQDGFWLRMDIPEGYTSQGEMLYIKGDSFIRIAFYEESEYAYPINFALSMYFAQMGTVHFTERVSFAYSYDISGVSVFDSENTIEIAAGCRILRSFAAIANDEGKTGVFYRIEGEYDGYLMSSAEEGCGEIVWSVCLREGSKLVFLTVKDPAFTTANGVKSLLQPIAFTA